jgi:serine/threonine protein kinase/Tfp pilus assembly protein PilF
MTSPEDFARARSLKRQLVDELREGWETGKPPRADEILDRWPGSGDDPDIASLLFEEYLQRCRHGEEPNPTEYQERFPSQKDAFSGVARQQEFLRAMGSVESGSALTLSLPEVGTQVFGFLLCQELGRGSFARVFLAEQMALAGRPVVVKVSAIDGDEPQTLAQLQHTNIVPIYSVHEDAAAGLRVVCMPYFGGASLSRVLEAVFARSSAPQHGSEIVDAMRQLEELRGSTFELRPSGLEGQTSRNEVGVGETPLAAWSKLDYVRASAWIILRLAEALEHAHQRGVLHRDIKPSNVLLGADGEPMLLDFNLAQKQHGPHAQAMATLGGTVAYMAPEHLRALAARDLALAQSVDHRSDLYGLGMVLYELLSGRRPFDQSASYSPLPALVQAMALERGRAAPSLRAQRPGTPWSLESIIRKCLAADPANRYQSAGDLAEDLRRFLDDRPLKYAPELSWRERLAKWGRRHPRLTASGAIAAAAMVVIGVGTALLLTTTAKLQATQRRADAAAGSMARERLRQFEAGLERARCLVHTISDAPAHVDQSREICEKTLGIYDVLDSKGWEESPNCQWLNSIERQRLKDEVRELLVLLADARLRQALTRTLPPRETALWIGGLVPAASALGRSALLAAAQASWREWQEAERMRVRKVAENGLALLDRAKGPIPIEDSAALCEERARLLEKLGRSREATAARFKARKLPRQTAADHYVLASALSLQGDYARALPELREAQALDPRNYWVSFHLGICHYELGEYALALADFQSCVTLWPEFSLGLFNIGQVLHRLGKLPESIQAYSRALECDPNLAVAKLNRGLVYLEVQEPLRALEDFNAAIALGLDSVVAFGGRGIALEALGRHREADEAFEQAWDRDPENIPMLLGYGFAVYRRLPKRAESAFEKVLRQESKNPRALYGYAMLSAKSSRQSERALDCFTLALESDPNFLPARRGRADVLAHRGDLAKALEDINWCIKADQGGQTLYGAACIYATIARQIQDAAAASALQDRAISLLQEAFRHGYGQDRAADDEDLESLRNHLRFRTLLKNLHKPRNPS